MSSNKKSIQINPDLFKIGGKEKKKKEKKTRKKEFQLINPNEMKKSLISKIREHRRKNLTLKNNNNGDNKFKDEFNESMKYLDSLANDNSEKNKVSTNNIVNNNTVNNNTVNNNVENKNTEINNTYDIAKDVKEKRKKKKELKHNRTIKSYNGYFSDEDNTTAVNLNMPDELNEKKQQLKFEEVPYGCLKGGKKPTYRNWLNSTRKKMIDNKPKIGLIEQHNFSNDDFVSRQTKLKELKELKDSSETTNSDELKIKNEKPIIKVNENELKKFNEPLKIYNKKTFKRKYKLGRSKKNRTISVLLKGYKQKEKIQKEYGLLCENNLNNMKTYLKKRGLIKTGSDAPPDIIKQLYTSSILTGSVKNLNKETLMHNFLNDDL